MWFILLQIPISWLLYKLGILNIDSPDTVIVFFLQLWNIEPLFYGPRPRSFMGFTKLVFAGLVGSIFLYSVLGLYWTMRVKAFVPEPYLDEVFHIPQAQAYCAGRWDIWDDKITTPPGLYVIAVLYHKLLGRAVCTANSLRNVNLIGIYFIHHAAFICRNYIESRPEVTRYRRDSSGGGLMSLLKRSSVSYYANHSAINIAAFPVLFFFSGLFYTDVFSAVSVLVAYQVHLLRVTTKPALWKDILAFLVGVATLFMRQTNVFWVAVYLGGLEAVHVVKSLRPAHVKTPDFRTLIQVTEFYLWRYSIGDIHDLPLEEAWPDDWLFTGLSIAIAIVCNPVKVLKQIWPYVSVVGLFASFVGWNGGVVLGDKSNHVATIHLAQMLYIWPFFAFFSAPLLIPPALSWVSSVYTTLYGEMPTKRTKKSATDKIPGSIPADRSAALKTVDFSVRRLFYVTFLVGAAALSVGIVKYNTIIHPFTLADNRHYMFYVFRYTIRRSQAVRFALIPVYWISARLVWARLAGPETVYTREITGQNSYRRRPFVMWTVVGVLKRKDTPTVVKLEGDGSFWAVAASSLLSAQDASHAASPAPPPEALIDLSHPASTSTASPPTSTALLWLATTALSLVTAPLVEPRYFILPWLFWRLLVPAWPTRYKPSQQLGQVVGWLAGVSRRYDLTLVLETVWFTAVNLATFWVFLNKPFVWTAEDGTLLDGGRTQRFMW